MYVQFVRAFPVFLWLDWFVAFTCVNYLHDFFVIVGILSMKPVYQSYRCTGIFQSMKHSLFQAQSLRLPGYQIAYIVWGKKTIDSSVSMIYIMITSLS